ncbi:uncharacterized protein LOC130990883 [Salvia miltiorrhiza]|uniref:uncharacterized protein LOC130990883 n=1 Tax=Salvia miltiorrhiza TaxID=226208 RepID=UPI0025AD8E03|nr:uncharacterized protein LOC130990883 [Salvia miltiorrhiza]
MNVRIVEEDEQQGLYFLEQADGQQEAEVHPAVFERKRSPSPVSGQHTPKGTLHQIIGAQAEHLATSSERIHDWQQPREERQRTYSSDVNTFNSPLDMQQPSMEMQQQQVKFSDQLQQVTPDQQQQQVKSPDQQQQMKFPDQQQQVMSQQQQQVNADQQQQRTPDQQPQHQSDAKIAVDDQNAVAKQQDQGTTLNSRRTTSLAFENQIRVQRVASSALQNSLEQPKRPRGRPPKSEQIRKPFVENSIKGRLRKPPEVPNARSEQIIQNKLKASFDAGNNPRDYVVDISGSSSARSMSNIASQSWADEVEAGNNPAFFS